MDSLHPQLDPQLTPQSPPGYAVPRQSIPFAVKPKELLLAILSYPLAFLYAEAVTIGGVTQPVRNGNPVGFILFALFSVLFCLGTESRHRDVRAGWERWVWLGCMALCIIYPLWGGDEVWDGWSSLFAHGFAIYYVLCRANVLLEGRTSHLLPLDALWGAVVFPFKHFFLRIRVIWSALHMRGKGRGMAILWSALAVAAAAGAFILAGNLLAKADKGFAQLAQSLFARQRFELGSFFSTLLFSLPAGAYIYGLVVGTGREEPEEIRVRGNRICEGLEKLRAVPVQVWIALLGVFALLYGVFFVIQGRYLFGAFTRTLPEDFTVAEYARQGFFELCRVMVLNFALLWAALRSAGESVKTHRGLRIAATVILVESLLLAVTAGSKLWLYIDCFGFTPLRLQSAWLIAVLSAGVIAALWSLWTNLRSVRAWAIFSGVSLALLHLI